MSEEEEVVDAMLEGLTSNQVASWLYELIDCVETEKFLCVIDTVAETAFRDKIEGKESTWDLDFIVNEWTHSDNLRRTLLFHATFHNNSEIVESLLDHGADVNIAKESDGTTALYRACFNNNTEIVRMLMDYGGNPNIVNKTNGITCMWYAALKGNKEIMKLFLENDNANDNDQNRIQFDWDNLINQVKTDSGYGIFHLICENGHIDCLNYLWKIQSKYDTKIDTILPIRKSGNNAMLVACSSNKTETIKFLINKVYKNNKKFNINHTNDAGRSALWFACWKGNLEIVKLILNTSANSDINQVNNAGSSPFKVACEKNQYNIVKYLLSFSKNGICDINKPSKVFVTPLMTSIQNASIQTVKLLCKCDEIKIMGLKDKWNKDGLDYTVFYGNIELFQILLLTILKRNNVKTWNEIEKLDILNEDRFNKWYSLAESRFNHAFIKYLEKFENDIYKRKNFDLLLLTIDSINSEYFFESDKWGYENSCKSFWKDNKRARYMFDNLDKNTLNQINDLIHKGLLSNECGFDDSLLFLSKMIDENRLIDTLSNCTQKCLNNCNTDNNELNFHFYQNNLLGSKIWVAKIEDKSENKMSGKSNCWKQECMMQDDWKEDSDDSKSDDCLIENENDCLNSEIDSEGDNEDDIYFDWQNKEIENECDNKEEEKHKSFEIMYQRIETNVMNKALLKQRRYIQNEIIKQERRNKDYWNQLKYTIKSFNAAKGDKIRQWEVYSQYNIRQDLMNGHGVLPDFYKNECIDDKMTSFNGKFDYNNNGYLSKLLNVAHIVDPVFQAQCQNMLTPEILGVPCYYSTGLPKSKESCLIKAEKCYNNREWPQTGSICDIIRCRVVFDCVADLVQACVKFQHIVDRTEQSGCIKRVLRVENEFSQIADKSWTIDISQFDSKCVKFNVLIEHEARNVMCLVGEIQFSLTFMDNATHDTKYLQLLNKNGYNLKKMGRILHEFANILKQKQIERLILNQNMCQFANYLQNCTKDDERYLMGNAALFDKCFNDCWWIDGRKTFQFFVNKWKRQAK